MMAAHDRLQGLTMKKSKTIRLVLLGGASVALAACEEQPPDARFFADVQECAAVHGAARCEDAFAKSTATYQAEAPRFARKEQCEAEFGAGNCETRESAGGESAGSERAGSTGGMGSFFMPMMMGYMLGNAFRQPVYRGPGNGAMMRTGGKFYNVGTFAGAGRAASFQPARISPVRRGGFGATASSYRTSSGG